MFIPLKLEETFLVKIVKIIGKIKEKEVIYHHDEYAKHDASSSKTSKTNGAKSS